MAETTEETKLYDFEIVCPYVEFNQGRKYFHSCAMNLKTKSHIAALTLSMLLKAFFIFKFKGKSIQEKPEFLYMRMVYSSDRKYTDVTAQFEPFPYEPKINVYFQQLTIIH